MKLLNLKLLRALILDKQDSTPAKNTTGIVLYSKLNGSTGKQELYYVDDSGTERHVTVTP